MTTQFTTNKLQFGLKTACYKCQRKGILHAEETEKKGKEGVIYAVQLYSKPAPPTLMCRECVKYSRDPMRTKEWQKDFDEITERGRLAKDLKIVRFTDCDMNLIKYLNLKDRAELEFLNKYREVGETYHFHAVDDNNDLIKFWATPIFIKGKATDSYQVESQCGAYQFIFKIN